MSGYAELYSHFLDPFSTSPTEEDCATSFSPQKCTYNAPYIAWNKSGDRWGVAQGNCHHWDCPRCGQGRARKEYGRIVEGCRGLAENKKIYFITITCRGKGLTKREAEAQYLEWTNRFLDACRQKSKREGQEWSYVQVTERQTRGHPHSHILTLFRPPCLYLGHVWKYDPRHAGDKRMRREIALRSDWLQERVISAGLGEQYDVSIVETVEGASRYVAKYLFKPTIFTTDWPVGWKRVRYSQSFPKLPERETDGMALLSREDWRELAYKARVVDTSNLDDFDYVSWALYDYSVPVRLHQEVDNATKRLHNR